MKIREPPASVSGTAAEGGGVADGGPDGRPLALRPPEVFISFRSSYLRDSMLKQMWAKKGCIIDYPGVSPNTRIGCYLVLTHEKHALFKEIRSRANLRDASVWHYKSSIKGRMR